MINLRFHIVSIVAIFLALAIGMLAGSTLLDRATVDVLKGRQRSLDARNAELRVENDELRAALDAREPADAAFGSEVLPGLLPGTLDDGPVLLLATRGIDEESVRAVQSAIRYAGGAPLGIVWFDSRVDLDDAGAVAKVAEALDIESDGDGGDLRDAVVAEITGGLVVAGGPATTTTTTTTTTTVPFAPSIPGATPPATEPAAEASSPSAQADEQALTVLSALVDADLVDWESPNEGEPGSRTLPNGGLDIVVLSGEGSELDPDQLIVPLVSALADRLAGVVVGEVRRPRTEVESVESEDVPVRGAFVDRFRTSEDLDGRLVTVDDVDSPFGRLALVLALAQLPEVGAGDYGIAPTAERPFPSPDS